MEIGSEFWIESMPQTEYIDEMPDWINIFGKIILTSSGRGAISLMLEEAEDEVKIKTALLPAYICDSVILPFIEQGYKCYFYDINCDLTPSSKSIEAYDDIGIFLHMGYFGFSTNSSIVDAVKVLKANSTIIVEDITHTCFSNYERFNENDYYVSSLRKWMGLPSGGFMASQKFISRRPKCNEILANIRKEALQIKSLYLKSQDERLKQQYLNLFAKAEEGLDSDLAPYDIDIISKVLINVLDADFLKERRRRNFKILLKGLKDIGYIKPIFSDLPDDICPLFYAVYIKDNRSEVRKTLKEQKIYCPIHWSVPEQIDDLRNTKKIYDTVLSIPCDQRYGTIDMERVVEVLRLM